MDQRPFPTHGNEQVNTITNEVIGSGVIIEEIMTEASEPIIEEELESSEHLVESLSHTKLFSGFF